MANYSPKKHKGQRVAALDLPPGVADRCWELAQRPKVLTRILCGVLAGVFLWIISGGWGPTFSYHEGYAPQRDITVRAPFDRFDSVATEQERGRQANQAYCVYENDPSRFKQLTDEMVQKLTRVTGAESLSALGKETWQEFLPPLVAGTSPPTDEELDKQFHAFRSALPDQQAIQRVETIVSDAFRPFYVTGLLEELPKEHDKGQTEKIQVLHRDPAPSSTVVEVRDVQIGRAIWLRTALAANCDAAVAGPIFDWLRPRIPTTLKYLPDETRAALEQARARVQNINKEFKPGDVLAKAGEPLTAENIDMLRLEHTALVKSLSWQDMLRHSAATWGMYLALAVLTGVYVANHVPRLVNSMKDFGAMLTLVVITVLAARLSTQGTIRTETFSVMLLSMTAAIAYHQDFALLLGAAVSLLVVNTLGQGLGTYIILTATAATAIMLVGHIRSRTKLNVVGLFAGLVGFLTTIGVETLDQQPFRPTILNDALGYGGAAIFAGLLMNALLPYIEDLFGVQTDIRLLEMGDVALPLLQELVRRAPGTYNHSINVASLAEAAADSIGAHGLLVRVGAYYHDIGKMLKPGYFVENQGTEGNRHEGLHPAMSTLIIIAHIKDGADLARQHHLPRSIIDFIQQHHGTTLVEYFYRRASQQSESNPELGEVEESAFRYPGPKPQTREAAVLMLADAVESACRTLVEPTPARIENVVQNIAMKRLLDGQFDECELTLQDLATIQHSLVKSLTAVYHGRVKYPDAVSEQQRTA
jgi:putative nucleotidyltransferase with HDIG domain